MGFISDALGALMKFIYFNLAFESYGLAIIIFTILTKIALLPLSIKSFKSMQRNQAVQPEIQAVQRLYKDDKQRMQEEMAKIYQKHGVSPAAGCLPLLIQFPIIIALYDVIRKPLTHIMGITKITDIINKLGIKAGAGLEEIHILTELAKAPDKIAQVSQYIKAENIIDLKFLNIFNLGLNPTFDFNKIFADVGTYLPLLLIPILAALTTYIQTKLTQPAQKTSGQDNAPDMAGMTKSMSLIMPIMILFFSFSVPAGLGLYWIMGNVIQIGQQMLFNKILVYKKEGEN